MISRNRRAVIRRREFIQRSHPKLRAESELLRFERCYLPNLRMRIRCKNRWQHSIHTFHAASKQFEALILTCRRVLRHQFVIRSECRYSFGAGSVEPMILEVVRSEEHTSELQSRLHL